MRLKKYLQERYEPTEWWEKGETITLYHGTTWDRAKIIKKEGLKPLDVGKRVIELIKDFGLDPEEVPNWVKGEISLRTREKPRIYLTNRKQQAIDYAHYMSKYGGEASTSTVTRILQYKSKSKQSWKEIEKIIKPEGIEYAIVTVDMPWKEALTYRNLAQTLYKMKRVYGDNWKKEAKEAGFEFYSEKPIPKKYIVRIDKIV